MKKLTLLLVCALVLPAMISCKKNNNSDDSNPLIGTWEVFEAEGTGASLNVGTKYTWDSKGNMTTEKGFKNTGPYEIANDTIIWTLNDLTFRYIFSFHGQHLHLEPMNSGQLLKLKK